MAEDIGVEGLEFARGFGGCIFGIGNYPVSSHETVFGDNLITTGD